MTQLISTLNDSMPTQKHWTGKLLERVSNQTLIRPNEPLAKRTTLRVGGPADIYAEPASEKDLAEIIKFWAESKLPFFVLGRGSNVLVKDGGFRGIVICLAQPHFSKLDIIGERLHCGAGAKLKAVAVEAKRNN